MLVGVGGWGRLGNGGVCEGPHKVQVCVNVLERRWKKGIESDTALSICSQIT